MVAPRSFSSSPSPVEQAVGGCPAAKGHSLEPGAVGTSRPAVPGDPRVWEVLADEAIRFLKTTPEYTEADDVRIAVVAHKRLQRIAGWNRTDKLREIAGAAWEICIERGLMKAGALDG
jgi:hypothetical protein